MKQFELCHCDEYDASLIGNRLVWTSVAHKLTFMAIVEQ